MSPCELDRNVPIRSSAERRPMIEGHLIMSQKERTRMGGDENKSVYCGSGNAAEFSYRQLKRVWRRYSQQGDAGLRIKAVVQ